MKKIRDIVFIVALLLSQWVGAALVVNGEPDPNWLGSTTIGSTTEGNDFWLTFMTHNAIEMYDPSLNLNIIAVAQEEVDINVEVNGNLIGTIDIPVGGGEAKLVGSIPASMVYIQSTECEQTLSRGIHVYSTNPQVPFSCYAFSEAGVGQGTTRDASLVLPTHLLGKEYYVQTYQTDTRATEFAIVVTEDNTDVTITPKVQTSMGTPAGSPTVLFGLRKGTVYQVRSIHPSEAAEGETIDLSGSTVCATKPVAVFQGNEAVKIATGSVGSYSVNHAFEQTLPVSQWGTTFYLGLTEHAKSNFYNIIAAYDNTKVKINTGAQVTLNAGETFSTARNLSKVIPSAKVTADKPVLVSNYLSCGGANSEDYYDTEGTLIQYNWGNSTSAMIPAWESRVKEMSFFADTISNETDDGIGHMYVQVITKTADRAKLTLDGVSVPQTTFSAFSADASMSVANIELTEEGKHTLQTTGDGFVGFVYTITSEARAYQYTLGHAAKSFKDSMYVENEVLPMLGNYNLERVAGKGWYQRQWREWVKGRLDTASVCDSTELKWRIESPADTLFRVDSIHWVISALGDEVATKDTVIKKGDLIHRWSHQFIIPEEIKAARIPFVDYKVQALLYRTPLLCVDNLPIDTMQAMVRVNVMYNDTTWVILCAGDELDFFSDTTVTNPSERYTTRYYYNETEETAALPSYSKHKYQIGTDTITRSYISVGGCDSLSTLLLYVCEAIHDTVDKDLCEDALKDLNTELGDFFYRENRIDFAATFRNRNTDYHWQEQPDGSWYFEGTSRLKTYGCMNSEVQDYVNHGAFYGGCDSTLTLRLRVRPTEVRTNEASICASSYQWKRDDTGDIIQTITRGADNYKTPKLYTYNIKYKSGDCDSVRYELSLMFVDGGLSTDTIHVCQNASSVTKTHMGKSWDFNPAGQETGVAIDGRVEHFSATDGCEYDFKYVFWVDPLPTHRDTIVYCYEEGTRVFHTWEGHSTFWFNEKDSPYKTQRNNFTVDYPSVETGRMIYELSDTVRSTTDGACDDAYYQVVIVMPNNNSHIEKHMANTEVYEWNSSLLVGEKVKKDTITNPKGLPIVVMKPEGGVYPTGWEVSYDPDLKEYNILDSILTKPIHNAAGVAQQCDSVISLSLRVGETFCDTVYQWSQSDRSYYWQDRGTVVEVPQVTKDSIVFYYDSLKTQWPVIGLDSVYVLSLTVFPSYSDTNTVVICQDSMGYKWTTHMGTGHHLYMTDRTTGYQEYLDEVDTVPINNVGIYYVYDYLQTKTAHQFRHPILDTLIQDDIHCDSTWVLDLTVNTVYNADYTYLEAVLGLKSNDTLTFFTPKTLFIGMDFEPYRSGEKTADALKDEVGADKYEIVFRDSLYQKKASSIFGCDSITYLQLNLCKLQETFLVDTIGDNDSIWVFGGDTTRDAFGLREHTQPFVYGRDFNVDENGDPIDYTSRNRTVRVKEFVDSLRTERGCDSIVYMTLRIFPTYSFIEEDTICGNDGRYTWHGKTNLNKLVGDNETGVAYVYDSLLSAYSEFKVDSVYTLKLTIFPGELSYTTRTLCYNDSVLWHGLPLQYDPYEHTTEVVHYFNDEDSECGREIHMTPIFNPSYGYYGDPEYNNWVETIRICQYDDFRWLDKDGKEHLENLRDPEGNKYAKVPTDHVGYFTIYDSLKTVGCNCDSIYTLHYWVDTTYRYFTEEYLCTGDSYDWIVNGELYKTYSTEIVGDIYDTIHGTTIMGCDSSYYLHLHVDSTYHIYIEETLCPSEVSSYSWEGVSYDSELADAHYWDEPKEYYDTLRTVTVLSGCDSVRYLHLTIVPAKDSVWRDTICEGESYTFFDRVVTTQDTYVESRLNQWDCMISYRLTLDVIPPTDFTVSTDALCIDPAATSSYPLYYTYEGEFSPVAYNIYYDEKAKEAGFEDISDILISHKNQVAGTPYPLDIEVPSFQKLEYPTPGHYSGIIGFDNGVCEGDTLMRFPFEFTVDYPSWLMEQRHGDLIALLNEDYNGGYSWTEYQWYEGDSMLVGQTKPYLHIPTGLKVGAEYHVELIRDGETESFPTCPIVIQANPVYNDYTPAMGYLAVTPTCVVTGNPWINILSRKDGTYRVTTTNGRLVTEGVFRADVTPVQLPAIEGMYIVQLWSNDTPEEPYRAIKVLVRQQCPNCDISSF